MPGTKNYKRKHALRTQTQKEKNTKGLLGSPYESKQYVEHREAIKARVKKQQDEAHARAVIRKENTKPNTVTKKQLKKAKVILKRKEEKKSRNYKFLSKNK